MSKFLRAQLFSTNFKSIPIASKTLDNIPLNVGHWDDVEVPAGIGRYF